MSAEEKHEEDDISSSRIALSMKNEALFSAESSRVSVLDLSSLGTPQIVSDVCLKLSSALGMTSHEHLFGLKFGLHLADSPLHGGPVGHALG